MKPQLARALTRLYAPFWRRRYGAEFEAMLSDLPFTPAVLLDVVPRAMATHRYLLGGIAIAFACAAAMYGSRFSVKGPATHTTPTVALAACRSYSSIAQSGIITRRECLD